MIYPYLPAVPFGYIKKGCKTAFKAEMNMIKFDQLDQVSQNWLIKKIASKKYKIPTRPYIISNIK